MQVIKMLISSLLIISAFIHFFGLGYIYTYATFRTELFTFFIIGILLYSAIVIPKKKLLNILIYLTGAIYYIFLLYDSVYTMIQNDYFKLFDIVYPLTVSASFLILIYIAFFSRYEAPAS